MLDEAFLCIATLRHCSSLALLLKRGTKPVQTHRHSANTHCWKLSFYHFYFLYTFNRYTLLLVTFQLTLHTYNFQNRLYQNPALTFLPHPPPHPFFFLVSLLHAWFRYSWMLVNMMRRDVVTVFHTHGYIDESTRWTQMIMLCLVGSSRMMDTDVRTCLPISPHLSLTLTHSLSPISRVVYWEKLEVPHLILPTSVSSYGLSDWCSGFH